MIEVTHLNPYTLPQVGHAEVTTDDISRTRGAQRVPDPSLRHVIHLSLYIPDASEHAKTWTCARCCSAHTCVGTVKAMGTLVSESDTGDHSHGVIGTVLFSARLSTNG